MISIGSSFCLSFRRKSTGYPFVAGTQFRHHIFGLNSEFELYTDWQNNGSHNEFPFLFGILYIGHIINLFGSSFSHSSSFQRKFPIESFIYVHRVLITQSNYYSIHILRSYSDTHSHRHSEFNKQDYRKLEIQNTSFNPFS